MASMEVAAGDDAVGQRKGTGGGTTPPPPPAEQGLRCPRCDSPNTKFCYYNNYSLSQPRHFCKTCRRYWTKGGALRNVPVGGGCRKNKRSRSAAGNSGRLSLNLPAAEGISAATEQTAADSARLSFLGGGPVSSPLGGASADFHGAVGMLPGLHPPVPGQYGAFGEWHSVASGDITGGGGTAHGSVSSTITSSIESLSFINQDLHWKLQQQRVATMFLGPPSSATSHVDGGGSSIVAAAQFGGGAFRQMAWASGMESTPPAATSAWFMDSSYALPSLPPPAAPAAATTTSNLHGGGDDNASSNNNCGSAVPSWGDISTFAMLP